MVHGHLQDLEIIQIIGLLQIYLEYLILIILLS